VDFDEKDDKSFYMTSTEFTQYMTKSNLGVVSDELVENTSSGHVATGDH
jgi:hypothetical protein